MNNSEYSFEVLYDANNYIEAFHKCKRGCIWKEEVQRYELNLLRNINDTIKEIKNGTYKQSPFREFTLNERGKTRYIKAMHIKDRVVLHVLCDNILIPLIRNYLIYDNGASLKDKGVKFTKDRLKTHLHKYYRKNGSNEGYVLLIDFSKYFDNIQHEKLLEIYSKKIVDKRIIDFISKVLDDFKIDVSYMTDYQYQYCLDIIYNAIEYKKIEESLLTGEKYMYKSIGLGSQISQISGLFYASEIDNYCKIVKSLKYYGRYSDDIYIIHNSKEYLQELLVEIDSICKKYGITINRKKTQVVKLSCPFKFLRTRFSLTETGKVIERVNKDCVVRQRRKLKRLRNLLDKKQVPFEDIDLAYKSWKGTYKKQLSRKSLDSMDELFNQLFLKEIAAKRLADMRKLAK